MYTTGLKPQLFENCDCIIGSDAFDEGSFLNSRFQYIFQYLSTIDTIEISKRLEYLRAELPEGDNLRKTTNGSPANSLLPKIIQPHHPKPSSSSTNELSGSST